MKDMMRGKVEPYMFHMNWNNEKVIKRKFNQQIGDWYVQESCVEFDVHKLHTTDVRKECCVTTPKIVCHFRDKPSKVPCPDSPMIEGRVPFW